MATSLRLRPDAEAALRAEAERSGRSQQEILRDALDRYLDLTGGDPPSGDALLRSGALLPPRTRYRKVTPRRTLPAGVASLELLDRDTDRIRPVSGGHPTGQCCPLGTVSPNSV